MADHLRDATKKMDFISRESAINALVEKGQATKRYKLGQKWELNGEEVEEAISSVPAADVRPVDEAEWIPYMERGYCFPWYKCSKCGEKFGYEKKYCGNCGRKMRRSKDEL